QIDLIGVNTDGTIYALDGASGVALWTARFNPGARRGEKASPVAVFNPVASRRAGETIVIVAFEGGVRALRGETGSELWRTTLTGYAASGTAVGADGDRDTKIAIVTEKPSALYFLDPNNGGVTSRRILEATIIGSPVAFTGKEGGLVALALKGGVLDVRRANGERAHAVKVDVEYTTPPLIVTTPRGTALWIGSEHGLLAINTADLQPIGRIPTEGDMPRGALVAADLHGDGGSDIVIVTQRGRVAVINATDGKIEWVADGATDAASAIFADLNGDGTPDVIVAAGPAFARGFSGRDGTLIWEADEPGAPTKAGDAAASIRFLAITSTASGEAFLAGSDPSRAGIRAVELPKGSVKVAGK
ncbi:MAG: PQQ-binding-like beta-propeller repeat protein, partial [Methylobacteriaceae bacterium]|nr:PQQ-binding-like beta-propeller repeat protein [Methylobacteriaceae bacterium]